MYVSHALECGDTQTDYNSYPCMHILQYTKHDKSLPVGLGQGTSQTIDYLLTSILLMSAINPMTKQLWAYYNTSFNFIQQVEAVTQQVEAVVYCLIMPFVY